MLSSRLEQLLEAEAQGYAAFVTRLPLKLALIKRGQIGALDSFLEREALEQQRLRNLERERAARSAEVATALGLPPDASLAEISARLPAESARRLGHLRERILDLASRLKEGHERCELLLRTSLDFVRYSMELIGAALNPEERLADMLYGPEPSGPARSGSVLLNRTA